MKACKKTIKTSPRQGYVQTIIIIISITPFLFSDKNYPVIYIDINLLNYVLGYKVV